MQNPDFEDRKRPWSLRKWPSVNVLQRHPDELLSSHDFVVQYCTSETNEYRTSSVPVGKAFLGCL